MQFYIFWSLKELDSKTFPYFKVVLVRNVGNQLRNGFKSVQVPVPLLILGSSIREAPLLLHIAHHQ